MLPPPDAGDDAVGIAAELLLAKDERFLADHRLEIAGDPRERVGPDDRADDVVGCLHRAHPVAHRLVDSVAERAGAALHRPDLRPHHPHAADIRLLAADVLRPHVDDAVEAEAGTGGGGGDAVLAGAGLGNDPLLAHPHRQQALPERVVDLVGAGVAQILPLEPDLGPAGVCREPLGEKEGEGTADEGGEELIKLGLEGRIGPGLVVSRLELIERGRERFGDVAATEPAKPAVGVGNLRDATGRKRRGEWGRHRRRLRWEAQGRRNDPTASPEDR